jgi:hypothetical protein
VGSLLVVIQGTGNQHSTDERYLLCAGLHLVKSSWLRSSGIMSWGNITIPRESFSLVSRQSLWLNVTEPVDNS